MVKRVIGLPGDRIKIVNRNVMVNGHFLVEPYKVQKSGTIEDRDNFPGAPLAGAYRDWREEMPRHVNTNGELVVPPGRYFAMGDNRDNSNDSRYWGFVPRESILGRPFALYWSLDRTAEDYETKTTGDQIRDLIGLLVDLPQKTRWHRLFLNFPRANP
jgi:signal peptidase I